MREDNSVANGHSRVFVAIVRGETNYIEREVIEVRRGMKKTRGVQVGGIRRGGDKEGKGISTGFCGKPRGVRGIRGLSWTKGG